MKFKNCCNNGALEEASALPPQVQRALAWHQQDNVWKTQIYEWVLQACPEWAQQAFDLLTDPTLPQAYNDLPAFLEVYLFWHFNPNSGATIAQLYFCKIGGHGADWKEWYDAQCLSWLGIWEIRQVDPGRGVQVVDLLTQQERYVYERQGSRQWKPYDTVLGRVIDIGDGISVVAGVFPITLPPRAAEAVRQRFMEYSFPRRRKLKPADLRLGQKFADLANCWNGALVAWYQRPQPTVVNQDGDPMELCTDHFAFSPNSRPELLKRLGTLGAIEDDGMQATMTLSRAPRAQKGIFDTVNVGTIRVQASQCQAQANSQKRADDLFTQIIACAGDLLEHHARDLREPRKAAVGRETPVPREVMAIVDEHVRQLRQQHMNQWLDRPVPLLSGKTPRQAVRDPKEHRELRLLLKEFAYNEARAPETQRISLDYIHQQLGLVDGR